MTTDGQPWSRQVDRERPCAARTTDAFLGGNHNFGIDRRFVERAEDTLPGITEVYRENRAFVRRAVEYLLDRGIRQFLELGSGMPTLGHIHETARRRTSDFRVLYVDNELLTTMHGTRLLADEPRAAIIRGDCTDPVSVLRAPGTHALLDLRKPVALVLSTVLQFIPDSADPQSLVAEYRERLAPGSHLVVSHVTNSLRPREAELLERIYADSCEPLFARDHDWIDTLFGDFELLPPGTGSPTDWRPDPHVPASQPRYPVLHCGMARKKQPTMRRAVPGDPW